MRPSLPLLLAWVAASAALAVAPAPPGVVAPRSGAEGSLARAGAASLRAKAPEPEAAGRLGGGLGGSPFAALPPNFAGIASQAFTVVGVAELFDKTWFVTLLYSLQYGPKIAFVGSSLALALHVVVAAGLGAFISRFFALWALHLATALTFSVLAALYVHEFATTDAEEDALQNRTEDAKQDVQTYGTVERLIGRKSASASLSQVCIAVFVAEWGDRTQIAMISLHSSLPLLPVCLGSLVAFIVLAASAALVAQLLQGRRLSERLICGVSAASFLVFAAIAYVDAAHAWRARGAV